MSQAALAVSFKISVACMTTLLPDRSSSEDPAGIGALVISSTVWLVSVADVSETRVTVAVIEDESVFPSIHPITIVVVLLGTVYMVAIDVTPALVFNLKLLAILLS
tara:strand:+ start:277 stop:594 length:318 start_codon:yes stop_codon:yes gene_type:complete